MYKCKDCGKEYKTQVEYCDCGNNTFDFVEDVVKQTIKVKEPMSLEMKSQIVSSVFFAVCLLFSLIVWLIPVKTSVKEEVKAENKTPVVKNIPDIDKIWDSTPVKVVQKEQLLPELSTEPIKLNVIPYDNVMNKKDVKQTQNVKPTQTAKPAQNVKPAQNNTKPKTQNVTPKAQNTKPNTRNTKPKAQNTEPKTQNASSSEHVKPKEQQKVVTQPKISEEVKQQPKKVYNPNSAQMLKYKGELRAVLFRKFPIGSVQGSGNCSVHFSLDRTGKLTNRGFTKLSDNKSLNDAVYYMLMSVPKYTAPPEEYSGEMINMNFVINNGSYEITIN